MFIEQVAKLKKAWNLAPVLQILQKISEKYCPCLYLSIDQVWLVNDLWFKRYVEKCTLPHVLILIMMSQIYMENQEIVKNTKTRICQKQNITFFETKKFLM